MNPSWSIVFFTTLAGAAQGLIVVLALAHLLGAAPAPGFVLMALAAGLAGLLASLGSAFLHLGRPSRAWRAVAMWRTSWMSREVIALPALMAVVAGWALVLWMDLPAEWQTLLAVAALLLSALLWLCTGMVYACLRMVQEWAHPLTVLNCALMGQASGTVLAGALAAVAGVEAFAGNLLPWALGLTLLALGGRVLALRRNARLAPRSTPQSATGLNSARVAQLSMGFTGSSHNTQEFFHHASPWAFRLVKPLFLLLGFQLPVLLLWLAWGGAWSGAAPWALALLSQSLGLLAERWFFFAQARHPQNLYYQAVA